MKMIQVLFCSMKDLLHFDPYIYMYHYFRNNDLTAYLNLKLVGFVQPPMKLI